MKLSGFHRILFLVVLSAIAPSWSRAQVEDPFGIGTPATNPGLDPLAGTTDSSASNAEALLPDSSAVVQSLRLNPPQTPVDIARAILYMVRLERWKEAARYLDGFEKLSPDDATLQRAVNATGLAPWITIEGRIDDFSQSQRAFVRKVMDDATASAHSTSALSDAVQKLADPSLAERGRAARALIAAGDAGLEELVNALPQFEDSPPPIAIEIFVAMRLSGVESLRAAIASDDPRTVEQAFRSAAKFPGDQLVAELLAGIHILPPDGEAGQFLRKALSPNGQAIPSSETVYRLLIGRAQDSLHAYQTLDREATDKLDVVWRQSTLSPRIEATQDDARGKVLETAFRYAKLATQLRQANTNSLGLPLAIVFERQGRLTPSFELASSSLDRFPPFLSRSASSTSELLALAWESAQHHGLAFAKLRILQETFAIERKNRGLGTAPSFLAAALSDGVPAVRYQAALIGKLRAEQIAAGSLAVAYHRVRNEILQIESRPLTLLIGGDVGRRDLLSGQLNQMGYRTITQPSARAVLQYTQTTVPLEWIVIVDRVLELPLSELVQRLRANPRTSRVPILFLTEAIKDTERSVLESSELGQIQYSLLTSDLERTRDLVLSVKNSTDYPQLESIDRIALHAIFGSETSPSP